MRQRSLKGHSFRNNLLRHLQRTHYHRRRCNKINHLFKQLSIQKNCLAQNCIFTNFYNFYILYYFFHFTNFYLINFISQPPSSRPLQIEAKQNILVLISNLWGKICRGQFLAIQLFSTLNQVVKEITKIMILFLFFQLCNNQRQRRSVADQVSSFQIKLSISNLSQMIQTHKYLH